jgi:hypothetical protein
VPPCARVAVSVSHCHLSTLARVPLFTVCCRNVAWERPLGASGVGEFDRSGKEAGENTRTSYSLYRMNIMCHIQYMHRLLVNTRTSYCSVHLYVHTCTLSCCVLLLYSERLAIPPIAIPPVAQYRRVFSATLGGKTLVFLCLGHRRNSAAFLELHRAAVYRGPTVYANVGVYWGC